ncbi:MAG: hypothetical protein ABSD79_05245 [Dehalococcoidales bacterium]|jgi:hypothetical protein
MVLSPTFQPSFIQAYHQLGQAGLVTPDMLTNYSKANYNGLHSKLNYALIKAGILSGYFAIPEFKLRLKEPLKTSKGKFQWLIQVDTALFENNSLKGVGEVFTLDEIHGCVPKEEFALKWQTPHEKLNHIVRHFPSLFIIIINVIPGEATMPNWAGIKDRTLDQWRQAWSEMAQGLAGDKTSVYHFMISESGVEIQEYPSSKTQKH